MNSKEFLASSTRRSVAIDTTRVKADIPDVLDRLGLKYEIKGSELFALCPNPEHNDQHVGTWSIRDERGGDNNGLYHCFACAWSGSVFDLVRTVVGCGFNEAVEFVGGSAKLEDVDPFTDADFSEYLKPIRKWKPVEMDRPPVQEIVEGSVCQRYLAGRGVTKSDIEYWGLADWRQRGRVFVPLTREGELISWLARTYSGAEKKVLYPEGPQRWAMFGLSRVDVKVGRLHLAEGWLDAIRLAQAGFANVVGVGGSMLTAEKALDLSWSEDIMVWMDGDGGGEWFVDEVVAWLGRERGIMVVEMPEGKDPADHTPEELKTFEPVAYSDYRRCSDG